MPRTTPCGNGSAKDNYMRLWQCQGQRHERAAEKPVIVGKMQLADEAERSVCLDRDSRRPFRGWGGVGGGGRKEGAIGPPGAPPSPFSLSSSPVMTPQKTLRGFGGLLAMLLTSPVRLWLVSKYCLFEGRQGGFCVGRCCLPVGLLIGVILSFFSASESFLFGGLILLSLPCIFIVLIPLPFLLVVVVVIIFFIITINFTISAPPLFSITPPLLSLIHCYSFSLSSLTSSSPSQFTSVSFCVASVDSWPAHVIDSHCEAERKERRGKRRWERWYEER